MPTFAFAVPVPLAGSENYYIGALRQPYERNNNTPSLAGCMEMDGYRWEIPVVSARTRALVVLHPGFLKFRHSARVLLSPVGYHTLLYQRRLHL